MRLPSILQAQGLEQDFLTDVCSTCTSIQGEYPLIVHLMTQDNNEFRIKARKFKVNPAPATITCLRDKLGKENVWISKLAA